VPDFGNWCGTQEEIEANHLPHLLPGFLCQWHHRAPANPAVASEEQIEAQQEHRKEDHAEYFMDKPKTRHQIRRSGLAHDVGIGGYEPVTDITAMEITSAQ
jgi:hypothetical protein